MWLGDIHGFGWVIDYFTNCMIGPVPGMQPKEYGYIHQVTTQRTNKNMQDIQRIPLFHDLTLNNG